LERMSVLSDVRARSLLQILLMPSVIASAIGPVRWLSLPLDKLSIDSPPWAHLPSPFEHDPLQRHATQLISDADADALQRLLRHGKWRRITTHRGITVYEQRTAGCEQVCLRAEGDLDASAEAILDIFRGTDVKVIRDYNPSYDEGRDIVTFAETGDDTKVSWAVSKGIRPLVRPREFITRVRYVRTPEGAVAVISDGLQSHERAPSLRSSSVRASIITAVQLVAPRGEAKCHFTSVAQVDPGGALPAWFTNTLARRDAPRALLRLEAAAQKATAGRQHTKRIPWEWPPGWRLPARRLLANAERILLPSPSAGAGCICEAR